MLSTSSHQMLRSARSATAATRPSPGYCRPGTENRRAWLTITQAWSELVAASAAIPASPYFPVAAAGVGAFSYAYVLPFWQNTRPTSPKSQYGAEVPGVYSLYTNSKKGKTASGISSKRSKKAGTIRIKAK